MREKRGKGIGFRQHCRHNWHEIIVITQNEG